MTALRRCFPFDWGAGSSPVDLSGHFQFINSNINYNKKNRKNGHPFHGFYFNYAFKSATNAFGKDGVSSTAETRSISAPKTASF
ncbi:hypothetical protein J27TS8_30240 [Robertmurraya siralis]|uniref:Uncharacterized protein n=1 Tax=Robertmurraya siralis TaxID=77777 RepID=A0A919WJT5_9BACI|nr:hypothetical protein J27TS8_30240 [Robertmurraya siralis]